MEENNNIEEQQENNVSQEKYENLKQEYKKVSPAMYIVIAALIITAFFGGFAVKGMLKDDDSKSKKEEKTEETNTNQNTEEKQEEKKELDDSPVTDKFTVNLYADSVGVYTIYNGDLYYLEPENMDDGRYFLLTHSGCLSDGSSEYCKGNPIYNRTPVKIEGLSNVKKIKLFNGNKSGGESFQNYAITEDGNVYEVNKGSIGNLVFSNVVDMIGDKDNQIIVVYKDGTQKAAPIQYSANVQ